MADLVTGPITIGVVGGSGRPLDNVEIRFAFSCDTFGLFWVNPPPDNWMAFNTPSATLDFLGLWKFIRIPHVGLHPKNVALTTVKTNAKGIAVLPPVHFNSRCRESLGLTITFGTSESPVMTLQYKDCKPLKMEKLIDAYDVIQGKGNIPEGPFELTITALPEGRWNPRGLELRPIDPDRYFTGVQKELAAAIDSDRPEDIRRSIARGASVNAWGKEGLTPLLLALVNQKRRACLELLRAGANPNQRADDGVNPAMVAARPDRAPEFLAMILRHGGDPNTRLPNQDPMRRNRQPLTTSPVTSPVRQHSPGMRCEIAIGEKTKATEDQFPIHFTLTAEKEGLTIFPLFGSHGWNSRSLWAQDTSGRWYHLRRQARIVWLGNSITPEPLVKGVPSTSEIDLCDGTWWSKPKMPAQDMSLKVSGQFQIRPPRRVAGVWVGRVESPPIPIVLNAHQAERLNQSPVQGRRDGSPPLVQDFLDAFSYALCHTEVLKAMPEPLADRQPMEDPQRWTSVTAEMEPVFARFDVNLVDVSKENVDVTRREVSTDILETAGQCSAVSQSGYPYPLEEMVRTLLRYYDSQLQPERRP